MLDLDLSGVQESGVPQAGDYTVTCVHAELMETKSGTGEYIKVKLEADSGQIFFHNFNTKNDNKQAVDIGLGQLKKFLRVSGVKDPDKIKTVMKLVGLKVIATVKVEDKDDGYGPKAKITNFKPVTKQSGNPDPFA
jgi:hypothetical protein